VQPVAAPILLLLTRHSLQCQPSRARDRYDVDSASSQWFWLLFDSDLTPAGKNLLDGRYSCFGYTVEGARLLADVKEGDVIVSAKVVDGLDRLSKA